MIIMKLKPYIPVNGITHTSTSWEVHSDNTGASMVYESPDNSDDKEVHYSSASVPENMTYYIRARRHLSNSSVEDWTPFLPVTNTGEDSSILVVDDTNISRPFVYADKAAVSDSNLVNAEFNTSMFKAENQTHMSTNWLFLDQDDNIIHKSMYDENNLTSISVDKVETGIGVHDYVKVTAIHVGGNGTESPPGHDVFQVSKMNYTLKSNFNILTPYTDTIISFEIINTALPLGIDKVMLVSSKGSTLIEYEVTTNLNTITIPASYMTEDRILYLRIAGISVDGESTVNTIVLKVGKLKHNISNNNIVYDRMLRPVNFFTTGLMSENLTVKCANDGMIFLPRGDSNVIDIYARLNTTGELLWTGLSLPVSVPRSTGDSMYIEYLPDNIILIDTYDISGTPKLYSFRYNPVEGTYTVLPTVTRVNEDHPKGFDGSAHVINGRYYYITKNTSQSDTYNELKSIDYINGTVTTHGMVPLVDGNYANTFLTRDNRIVIVGGTNEASTVYNPLTDDYSDSYFIPEEFRDRPLLTVKLLNGDSILLKRSYISGVDTNLSGLYYDSIQGTLQKIVLGTDPQIKLNSSLTLSTGEVIVIDNQFNLQSHYAIQ